MILLNNIIYYQIWQKVRFIFFNYYNLVQTFTHDVPMRDDKENKTYSVQYQIDIPVVIFSYKVKRGESEVVFETRYAYNSMFEKFQIKKEEVDETNPEKIVKALEKCFETKKVQLEIFQKTNYSIDFRTEDDKTIFKAFLEPKVRCNQAPLKAKPDQKVNIQWEIDIPYVIFSYTDENNVVFEEKMEYDCMFAKFGMQQKDEDKKNGISLQSKITGLFYQNKVLFEPFQIKYYDIEFRGENDNTLFKVFFKPKMNSFVVSMKDEPDKKFKIEWVVDIPNVIFTYKEMKDGKELLYRDQLNYDCTFEKFGIKKEEKDVKNPTALTNVIKKYFEDGKVRVLIFQKVYYALEFLGEENKTLFQVFLRY